MPARDRSIELPRHVGRAELASFQMPHPLPSDCAMTVGSTSSTSLHRLRLYLDRQASNPARYALEQVVYALFGWIPTVIGLGLRAVFYRLIMHLDGWAGIEHGVRLRFADHIRLGPRRLSGPGCLSARVPGRDRDRRRHDRHVWRRPACLQLPRSAARGDPHRAATA